MTHRLWWRVTDILPLAEHAAATGRHIQTGTPRHAGWTDCPALIWTSDPDGDWLCSNGIPVWYSADGALHRIRAETWSHPATGTTGNPAQADELDGVLPLLAEHLDGRRTLLDLLRFARQQQVHWLGLHHDPASDETNTRYQISLTRGDVAPPDATWTRTRVTSPTVGGGSYQALVADGYTASGGVLPRFPRDAVQRMAEDLYHLNRGDILGEYPQVRLAGNLAIIERELDADQYRVRVVEEDRVHADADDCYAIGTHQWNWMLRAA